MSQCVICGAEYGLAPLAIETRCVRCQAPVVTRFSCPAGHAECDVCRSRATVAYLLDAHASIVSADPVAVFFTLRQGNAFPQHGPEHHALAAASVLFAYAKAYDHPDEQVIASTIDQAALLPMGTCGLWGACSAALGVGMAVGAILGSTPKTGDARGCAQLVVAAILGRLGQLRAPRCCRRETLLSLRMVCDLSSVYLPHPLATTTPVACDQMGTHAECRQAACPFHRALSTVNPT
jgi:hypothetical protein